MKKKVLTSAIMAVFVATALSACGEEQAEVLNVNSIDQCISSGVDFLTCQGEWDRATQMHEDVAPKFDTAGGCYGEFGDMCQNRPIRNADGSTSNVWLPMMAGMMMGNMMSNGQRAVTQPLYMQGARKDGNRYVGTYATPGGVAVSPGRSNMNASLVSSSPTRATVASTKSSVSSRGGFGSSARGNSGAS